MEKLPHESRHITTLYNYVVIGCYVLYILLGPERLSTVPTGTEALFLISRQLRTGLLSQRPYRDGGAFFLFPGTFRIGLLSQHPCWDGGVLIYHSPSNKLLAPFFGSPPPSARRCLAGISFAVIHDRAKRPALARWSAVVNNCAASHNNAGGRPALARSRSSLKLPQDG